MLFHMSIEADDPRRVAQFFADIWGGAATPFPPVTDAAWVAMAGDARNTMIEVYPRGTELREADGDADAYGMDGGRRSGSASHMAIGTPLSMDRVLQMAAREGWPAKYRKRGGLFGVIELWVEGRQMVELLTPDMQREYLETMTVENWQAFLNSSPAPGPVDIQP